MIKHTWRAGTKSASSDPFHLTRNKSSPEESAAPIIRSAYVVKLRLKILVMVSTETKNYMHKHPLLSFLYLIKLTCKPLSNPRTLVSSAGGCFLFPSVFDEPASSFLLLAGLFLFPFNFSSNA